MKEVISMFGKAPIDAIETHADVCLSSVQLLHDLFRAPTKDAQLEMVRRIVKLEKEADEIKREIRGLLARRMFMPVSRQELLDLVLVQDKIANRAKDVAKMYSQRFDALPPQVVDVFHEFIDTNIAAAEQARHSIHELDELFETGFRGAEVELVTSMVEELDRLEGESDASQWRLRRAVQAIEDELKPVDVMFWYKIITVIGQIGDIADRCGRQLEMMLTK